MGRVFVKLHGIWLFLAQILCFLLLLSFEILFTSRKSFKAFVALNTHCNYLSSPASEHDLLVAFSFLWS